MTNTGISYPDALGKIEPEIADILKENYQVENVTNIICAYRIYEVDPFVYIIEDNRLNNKAKSFPPSKKEIPFSKVDLKLNEKLISPSIKELEFLKNTNITQLSEFFRRDGHDFISVDLDYVFLTNTGWKGFEFTTFYMPFTNKEKAERLVSTLKRRPSWRGQEGAIALRKIVASSMDLNVDFYFIAANTTGKEIGSPINTDGNCLIFKLDYEQISRLEKGDKPTECKFGKFRDFCDIIEQW